MIHTTGDQKLAKNIAREIAALGYDVYYAETDFELQKKALDEYDVDAIVKTSGGWVEIHYLNGAHVEAWVEEDVLQEPGYSWDVNDQKVVFTINGNHYDEITVDEPFFGKVSKPGDPPIDEDELEIDEDSLVGTNYSVDDILNFKKSYLHCRNVISSFLFFEVRTTPKHYYIEKYISNECVQPYGGVHD